MPYIQTRTNCKIDKEKEKRIKERLGEESIKEYYSMLKGELIVPPCDIFEGFTLVIEEQLINEKLEKVYYWKL